MKLKVTSHTHLLIGGKKHNIWAQWKCFLPRTYIKTFKYWSLKQWKFPKAICFQWRKPKKDVLFACFRCKDAMSRTIDWVIVKIWLNVYWKVLFYKSNICLWNTNMNKKALKIKSKGLLFLFCIKDIFSLNSFFYRFQA